jgi:hypothetical protein
MKSGMGALSEFCAVGDLRMPGDLKSRFPRTPDGVAELGVDATVRGVSSSDLLHDPDEALVSIRNDGLTPF